MRVYIDKSNEAQIKQSIASEDNKDLTLKDYDASHYTVNHNGRKYVKVGECIHTEKSFKKCLLSFGGWSALIFSMGLAECSKDILYARQGKTVTSFYAATDDHIDLQNLAKGILNPNRKLEDEYRSYLVEHIEKSFKELFENEHLVSMLSEETGKEKALEDGRDQLITLEATVPFANYLELKELENEIKCPPNFENPSEQGCQDRPSATG